MNEETTNKINSIIKDKYGDYKPRAYKPFKNIHEAIRKGLNNDDKFLEFLEAQVKGRPVYKSPLLNNEL
jgi:hypothetical protein